MDQLQIATPSERAPTLPGRPQMLSHLAYVTHDIEATVDFYEGVLGMEMVASVLASGVPSTGDDIPYFHVFFRLGDGSTIAFFEAPGVPPANPKGHAAYDIFDHVALEVPTVDDVERWAEWLRSNGLDVLGPVDHRIIYSIYFHDNNGIRLEITTPLAEDWNARPETAHRDLENWVAAKRSAYEENGDVAESLVQYIENQEDANRAP